MQLLWKMTWQFLNKLHIELPCDPAISLLGAHANTQMQKQGLKQMVVRPCSKQHCSQKVKATQVSTNEWTNYVCTYDGILVGLEKETLTHAKT